MNTKTLKKGTVLRERNGTGIAILIDSHEELTSVHSYPPTVETRWDLYFSLKSWGGRGKVVSRSENTIRNFFLKVV